MKATQRHILIILDGFGIAVDRSVSAIDHARKPFIDELFASYPHSTLEASGLAVGLPEGQMGNSEVGHMNLGAGRVVYQEITRIDKDIREGAFFTNDVLVNAARHAKTNHTKLHLFGCFSDGGVHASLNHLFAVMELARREGLEAGQVLLHAFTDGRDTDPHGALEYIRLFQQQAATIGVGRIASIIGRYYAMDRDKRWERVKLAYDLLTANTGVPFSDPEAAILASYAAGVTDEFVQPIRIVDPEIERFSRTGALVESGDAVVFFNFRADRGRQLTHAFITEGFDGFDRGPRLDLHYTLFTPYESSFHVPIAFPKVNLTQTLGEVMAARGGRQLRAAETEKYPHVTFFFSGGREEPFAGEDRILEPSPKVATYDLQPEMSALPLAEKVAAAITQHDYNLVVLNFANPDMVGHTGVFEAAVKAVETVDACTRIVVEAAIARGYGITIIADHGNADKMRNPDGTPNTAHTTALVPHLIIKKGFIGPIKPGKLGDIAPTILHLLGETAPPDMTGDVLV
ncbi:MAG: 2,3-bisphosphoglycerate-independent phosphoglycerate mutase [Rhodothermales bacterium]|nr:2,3-bisphosphoglycerate-independent phosphoglycerate mutase [Rhodothermales bacterium]